MITNFRDVGLDGAASLRFDTWMQPTKALPYPIYSRAERIADVTIHVLGITASLIASALFLGLMARHLGWGTLAALIVYSAALVLMLTASGIYHMGAYTRYRAILRRIDHAAIYVKIAGTFTPLAVLLGTGFGYAILAGVWVVALLGAVRKLLARRGKMTTHWAPFVALGWIGAALIVPLTAVAPAHALVLMTIGGLTYTAGVLFYSSENLRFANAIWHGFVLVASGCFFAAIATSVVAMT